MALGRLVIPLYTQMLEALLSQLHKAAASNDNDSDLRLLGERRLAPDMFPLFDQIRFVCLQAHEVIARLRGDPLPDVKRPETVTEAERAICDALIEVRAARESHIDTAAGASIRLDLDGGLCFVLSGEEYVRDWAIPQFHFHLVAAYAIMRAAGVPLGKTDYVGHMFRYREGARTAAVR